jgi:aminobenzoyl-glutamate transport protein
VPERHEVYSGTLEIVRTSGSAQSLLIRNGLREMFGGMVSTPSGFKAIAMFVLGMLGIGVAKESGLLDAIIRRFVAAVPERVMAYLLALAGIIASVAGDAAYVLVIPLYMMIFRHRGKSPLVGLALGYASVAAGINIDLVVTPLDGVLTNLTNEALQLHGASQILQPGAGLWFSLASIIVLTAVVGTVTQRIVAPKFAEFSTGDPTPAEELFSPRSSGESHEATGLRNAALATAIALLLIGLVTIPAGAPLRETTGVAFGNSLLMNRLAVLLVGLLVVAGGAYGTSAGTIRSGADVFNAMVKTISSVCGVALLMLLARQLIACIDYSNIPTLLAVKMTELLARWNPGPLGLLFGMMVIGLIRNWVVAPAIPRWTIMAPIFIPMLAGLGVDPAAVLYAFRIGSSPIAALSPVNEYFVMMVGLALLYDRDATFGRTIRLLAPYVLWVSGLWVLLFAAWYLVGLPWGL